MSRENEYEPVAYIVSQSLPAVQSVNDLRVLIYNEAYFWIGFSIGPESRYDDAAHEIWTAWQRRDSVTKPAV